MIFSLQVFALLITSGIFGVSAQSETNEECTTWLSEPAKCCPPASSSTQTSYIKCDGCVISTTTTGIHCMMLCPATPSTAPGTTTVTSCSTEASCTHTITTKRPWGCTITVPPETSTSYTDCGGCALETTRVGNARLGRGQVCVGGRKTVTATNGTATVTECSAET